MLLDLWENGRDRENHAENHPCSSCRITRVVAVGENDRNQSQR